MSRIKINNAINTLLDRVGRGEKGFTEVLNSITEVVAAIGSITAEILEIREEIKDIRQELAKLRKPAKDPKPASDTPTN